MWMRQEYKTNKLKFERPFELEVAGDGDTLLLSDVDKDAAHDGMQKTNPRIRKIRLTQNYSALGSTVWDGSIALAKMFDNRDQFPVNYLKKCRIIELGAGCGLVGLYTCLLGAGHTVVTDQKCCIPVLERNVQQNILKEDQGRISIMEYSWGENVSSLVRDGLFHLILAAEVLYSAEDSILLAKSIPELAAENARVFISMGRNRGGESKFVEAMKKQGWSIREVPQAELHCKYQDPIIKIIELHNPSPRTVTVD